MSEVEELKKMLVVQLRTIADEIEKGEVKPTGFTQNKDFFRGSEGERTFFIPSGKHQLLVVYEKQ
jgi:hypothetical protein